MTSEVPLEFRIKVSSLIKRELLVNSENWLSEPFFFFNKREIVDLSGNFAVRKKLAIRMPDVSAESFPSAQNKNKL